MQRLSGIGVSPGTGAGRAVVLIQRAQVVRFSIPASRSRRRDRKSSRTRGADRRGSSIAFRQRLPGGDLGALFEAQRLMVDDPMLLPRAASIISEQHVNAEWALQQVFDHLGCGVRRGRRSLPARAQRRSGRRGRTPSDESRRRAGSASATCSASARRRACWWPTSCRHRLPRSSIGASFRRSSPTPAAARITRPFWRGRFTCRRSSGLHDATEKIAPGTMILVDGQEGTVSIDPPSGRDPIAASAPADAPVEGPPEGGHRQMAPPGAGRFVTADGVDVRVEANVDLLGDASFARAQGAEGIGLFRSELLLAGPFRQTS